MIYELEKLNGVLVEIEPKWNVKCVGWWLEYKEHKVEIEPKWNVKGEAYLHFMHG